MNTTSIGRQAEELVANKLLVLGHMLIAKNWRTRSCEIDIVTHKKSVIYFTEVKYRSTSKFGDGFDYISRKKLNQMQYAAQVWCLSNNHSGDYRLQIAAVDGDNDMNIQLIEL